MSSYYDTELDRKSSRGMIYENEELRLRTININAEVERGQSDIKRLRRENEHLRREIWTLRDECDRLNKRFKAKLSEHEYGGCRGSGSSGRRCSGGGRASAGCDGNSDDSDSCDTCRCEDDGHCSDECCQEGGSCASVKPPLPAAESRANSLECNAPAKSQDSQPMQFDHLSVVSEETFSNPEMMLSQQPEHHLMICNRDLNGSQSTLRSLVAPLTPLTPVELVANQLNDLQATVPPLSYFENILSQHMGHNQILTPTPELGTSSSTTTGMTMKHTNGWDYNLQSPFSQRKYSNPSSPSRSPPPQPLTTFVPPATTLQAMPRIALNVPTSTAVGGGGNIETVAITTNATHQALNSPKHFFAPMKSRLRIDTELANRGQDSLPPGSPPPALETAAPMREPPDIFVNNALATPYQRPCPRISPHTDSVNLESILNDIETISEDILAIQLEKSKSRDNIVSSNDQTNNKDDTKKPYRSEMNLYLQYEGSNPEISNGTATTGIATAANYAHDANSMHKLSSRTRSLEREHTDSPAPHMPDPMAPFPEKCSYLGFEQLNQAAVVQQQSALSQKPPISVKPNLPAKPPPPLPPARRPAQPTEPPPAPPVGIAPNKSHLYKSIASAAASKRAIFSSTPSQLTRSLDVEVAAGNEAAVEGSDPLDDEAAKRKARRVSIVCGEEQQAVVNGTVVTSAPSSLPTATASCIDLTSAAAMVLQHPSVKAFRQISHSTPSSPHSSRRRTNSNTMTAGHAEVAATSSAPPSTTHHHHHRKESSDPAPMAATATATVSRTKCSRRHSEGTVHNAHRISNSSGGHHHHHTHHHQHSSLISSNPHHSHHSHQDSNHETVTSLSDRNSNSFGSSRESSTSFSMRSNRRKISISSNTGGKIPWCGCWGNGCL